MFDCERCGNRGKIREQYADWPPLGPPDVAVDMNATVETKWRWTECPECLGFSAIPMRLKRGW